MGRVEGKVAVVTGVGSGMGRAIANLYAKEGAKVVLAEYNEALMNECLAEIKATGGTAVAIKTDVSKEKEIDAMIQKTLDEYGRLDILVNNAGVFDSQKDLVNCSNEHLERVMGVNTMGPFWSCRAAVKIFLQQETGGTIVNVCSIAGLLGGRGGAAYTMSKHAAVGLTKSIAVFYGRNNGKIRANVIAPGFVMTGMSGGQSDLDQLALDVAADNGPYNAGEPLDIAYLALYLGSDESKFINGAVLAADGGWIAR